MIYDLNMPSHKHLRVRALAPTYQGARRSEEWKSVKLLLAQFTPYSSPDTNHLKTILRYFARPFKDSEGPQ